MGRKKSKKISDDEFMELCEEGTAEEVLAAIKAGANVNVESEGDWDWQTEYGMSITPMTLCLQRRVHNRDEGPELILALLDAGVDVNMEVYGLDEELDFDWDEKREKYLRISSLTPLAAAVLLGMSDLVTPLLDRGADPNARIESQPDGDGFFDDEGPLLCFIIEKGYSEETVKLLLDAGADINAVDGFGRTPLRIALEQDDREPVDLLLIAGADPRKLGEPQEKTLFELAMEEAPDWTPEDWQDEALPSRFEYLLDFGVDVNEQNEDGQTALMWAVRERKFEYVLKLLEAGADVNLRDDKGRTALMYLYGFNYAHYFDPDQRPDDTHVLDIIDALTGAGAGGAEADEDGMTALMYAAEKAAAPEVLTAILMAGSDPAARDKQGLYAYDYAMKNDALRGTVEFSFLTFSGIEKAASADGRTIYNKGE